MPPIIYWTHNYYFESIFGLLFFALGLLFLLKTPKSHKNQLLPLLISILFFSLGIYVRYDYALFYVPLALLGILFFKPSIKHLLIMLVFIIICLSPLLLINNSLYGHPLSSGQSSPIENRTPFVGGGKSLAIYPHNLKVIIFSLSFYLCIFVIYIAAKPILNKKLIFFNKKVIFLVIFTLIAFLLFSKFWLSGVPAKADYVLRDSYNRYFLPLYLTIFIIIFYVIKKLTIRSNNSKIILPMILMSLISILIVTNQVARDNTVRSRYISQAGVILQKTLPDSVLYIDNLDKIIYPHREVGLISKSILSENYEDLIRAIKVIAISKREQNIYFCNLENYNAFLEYSNQEGISYLNIENCLYSIQLE
jgi:hypothetical protein